jgi:hypothetical protein
MVLLELSVHAQLVLNPGQTWTYSFSSLPFVGNTNAFTTSPQGIFSFSVNGSTLQSGDLLSYEMFEGSPSLTPICAGTMTGSSPTTLACTSPVAWQDREGSVRFTMLSGSVTVDTVSLTAIVSGPSLSSFEVYSSTFTPVPEPTGLFVFGSLACVSWLWLRRAAIAQLISVFAGGPGWRR